MGKATGFLEFDRRDDSWVSEETRITNFNEFHNHLNEEERQALQAKLHSALTAKGETLEDILVEAFATAREAAFRVIGEKHYFVQILGALAIHYGNIAEMKTGEGKTLTTIFPAYVNALTGLGVHVVTVNDYLAQRDAGWNGPVYDFLGLSVGVIINRQEGLSHLEVTSLRRMKRTGRRRRPVVTANPLHLNGSRRAITVTSKWHM